MVTDRAVKLREAKVVIALRVGQLRDYISCEMDSSTERNVAVKPKT